VPNERRFRTTSRRRATETSWRPAFTSSPEGDGDDPAVRFDDDGPSPDLRPAALDRIIRVGTWVFLLAATVIVAVTDVSGANQGPVLAVLAIAALYTLVLHELIPPRIPETPLLVVEGALSLLFGAVLIALTGGAGSPFFFALPLVVAGAATVVNPSVTVAMTAGASAAYVAAVLIPGTPPGDAWLATTAVNLTGLCLIAYTGTAIGREQRRAREDANRLATVDPLTGLRTRPYLFGALDRELARSQRTGRGFCLLMIDLDDLKGINDRHGHLTGDRALRLVGDVVRAGIRRIDTGGRVGGDEFVVLLPETDPTGGWVLAEKMRRAVSDGGLLAGTVPVRTSVSIGLVTYPHDGESVGELLERADEAMYRSKHAGRDRVTGVPVIGDEPSGVSGREEDPARESAPTGSGGHPV
jgi:diguanylate cyclase (GGDEF)-like protein